ncbi:hypothetical protein [Pontibacter chinhatensis]|uniref:Cthe-2314-like HEPN domain-containing protein n=1 Tax=Pontibacter chinhatensis TaxID=1436961 RepID=A0A1I2QIM6_9BACT|nr:hypothetical protein [Pontibacter chinhatensis]SFG28244.1 hypothetical protein SAMN05421739_10226 [Pontibacter chinhatensis]
MKIDEKELDELNNNDMPYFSQSGRGIFVGFEYRFLSLRRYINYTHLANKAYLGHRQNEFDAYEAQSEAPEDRVFKPPFTGQEEEYSLWELTLAQKENLLADQEHFNEYLYKSLFMLLYSTFEDFLKEITAYGAELSGTTVELKPFNHKMSDIHKHLLFLKYSCGLETALDKEKIDQLDLYRKIRNKFVHALSKDLPEFMRQEIEKLVHSQAEKFEKPDYEFVMRAYDTFTDIAFRIQEAFEERFFNTECRDGDVLN